MENLRLILENPLHLFIITTAINLILIPVVTFLQQLGRNLADYLFKDK